jgi:alpha-ketoglutarate-dependent taurine dioxygenase
MKIEFIKPHIGARVFVDRSSLWDGGVAIRCLELMEERCVVVFPRLGPTEEEQLAFTDRLGTQGSGTRDFQAANRVGEKNIFELSLNTDDKMKELYVKTSYFWHIDGLHSDDPLPKGTLLTARRIAKKGGQTEFANTYAAYDHLPDDEKLEIADLRALNTPLAGMRNVLDAPTDAERERLNNAFPSKHYPIVWTHRSGRKSLNIGVGADYVIGMPVPEGRALLSRLLEWTVQPEFKYRHEWQEGDLVLWNNHVTLHRAIPYDPKSGRSMLRTSFESGTERPG